MVNACNGLKHKRARQRPRPASHVCINFSRRSLLSAAWSTHAPHVHPTTPRPHPRRRTDAHNRNCSKWQTDDGATRC